MSERKRESNFTNSEIKLLLHLCNTYKKQLENKITNVVTWKEKLLVWEKIHLEFNSTTEGPSRTIKNLRTKYDSMKKEVWKFVAKQKKYVTGRYRWRSIHRCGNIEPCFEQLHQTIKTSSNGLICEFDSDNIHINLKNTDELDYGIMMEEIVETSIIVEENNSPSNPTDTIRVNFSDYSAPMLQTAKPKELQRKNISTDVDQVPTNSASLFEKSCSSSPVEQTRIHFNKKKKPTVSSVVTTCNDLCTLKAELVKRELEILGKKEQENTIEHQLRTKKLNLEIEKLELGILFLKKSTQS